MSHYFKSLFLVGLLTTSHFIAAQDSSTSSKHSISFEALGRSIVWGALNYEYQLASRFSLGLGFGYSNSGAGQINRIDDGSPEIGRYLDISSSQMLFVNYFIGQNKHQLLITSGLTNFWAWSRQKFPSETLNSSDLQIRWNVGLGYQYTKNKFFFRASAYAIRMPEPTGWFPPIFPWIGVSGGFRF